MKVSRVTDARRWDEVLRQAGGHPLQAWAWGALKERFGWHAHRLWVDDGRAAAQLLVRPLYGIAAAYVPRGPVLSGDAATDAALLDALERVARGQRAAFLRYEPDALEGAPTAGTFRAALESRHYRTVERTLQPRSSVRLDISRSDDELRAGLSKGHRADIRRAERNGVSVRAATSEDDVDRLHALLQATQARKAFGIHTRAYYRAIWRLFADDARLLLAEHEGSAVATALMLSFGEQAIYLAAGSTRAGLELRASHLLQWEAIDWARARGARSYDLWGIPDARGRLELAAQAGTDLGESERAALQAAAEADPLDGVFRFKKGWGGEVVRALPAFDRVYLPPAYWFWLRRRSDA